MSLESDLIRDEGMVLKPYEDTVGKLTIGVGRNLDDRGITEAEAMVLLKNDIEVAKQELLNNFSITRPMEFDEPVRFEVLVNMSFNLGGPRLATFRRMWAAIEAGDYATAADEMLDSKWADQVGPRADRLASEMTSGQKWESR